MNKFIFLAVLGLAVAEAELGLEGLKPSELKEVEREIAAGNVPPNFTAEKPKRGVTKLTNTDSPNFNQLTNTQTKTYTPQINYNPQGYLTPQTYIPGQNGLRLLYGNQNQYLSYLQNPQFSYQAVPHYVQTPTQVQYVSPPNYSQVPSAQFKSLTSKTPSATTTSGAQTNPQQSATSQVLPSNPATTPVQYVMYLVTPQQQNALLAQQQNALLAQQQALLYPGHQMLLVGAQNPLLSLYSNQHRFNLPYTSPAATQLTYLSAVPQQQLQQPQLQQYQQQQYTQLQQPQQYLQQPQQYQQQQNQQYQQVQGQQYQQTAAVENQKQAINVQEVASSSSFGLRTKA